MRRSAAGGLVLLAVLLGAVACAPPKLQVLSRLIDQADETTPMFDPTKELALAPVWMPPTSGEVASGAWSFFVPDAPARSSAGGLDLAPLRDSRYLVWQGELTAGDVEVLRLRFRERLYAPVELYWNSAGEDFAPQRYAVISPELADLKTVTFDLTAQPHWRGTIARIGVRLLPPLHDPQSLVAIEGLRYLAPPGLGTGEARRVTLGRVTSRAWLARPQTRICRAAPVPRDGRLRLLTAAWSLPGSEVPVRVVRRTSAGEHVLLETTLARSLDGPARWSRHEVSFGDWRGGEGELCFETGTAPEGALVAWGEPRVIGARRDRRPNVVFVSLDTVRADHLSLYGYTRPTTPNLEAWARRWGTVFETAVATAPWTLPSHVTLFTGIDAAHHGVNRGGPIPATMPLLAQRFRDAGYITYATTAGVLLTPDLGFARGFDEFRVRAAMVSLGDWEGELAAGIDEAVSFVAAHADERFFLFFHTFEPHTPYLPREPWFGAFGGEAGDLNAGLPVWEEIGAYDEGVRPRSRLFHPETWEAGRHFPKRVLGPEERPLAVDLYDSGLAYTDAQLSRLLARLETAGLMEDTVVVVTSDHGESLFEHGLVGHGTLYDQDLLVPLVVAAPVRGARGRRVTAQVRSSDVVPSLLELASLPPLPGMDGVSLVPTLDGGAAAPRDALSYARSNLRGISLRRSAQKLIVADTIFAPLRDRVEVYDLRRDPAEARNLAPQAAPAGAFQRLRREVRPGVAAIEIRIVNQGDVAFQGVLGGALVDVTATAFDLEVPCCTCCEGDPYGLRFAAPPGADFELLLQDAPVGTIELLVERGGVAWKGELGMGAEAGGHRVAWNDARWQAAETDGASGWSGIEIRRSTPRSGEDIGAEEMRRRLRALGYVR